MFAILMSETDKPGSFYATIKPTFIEAFKLANELLTQDAYNDFLIAKTFDLKIAGENNEETFPVRLLKNTPNTDIYEKGRIMQQAIKIGLSPENAASFAGIDIDTEIINP